MRKLVILPLFFSVAALAGEMKSLRIGDEVPVFALKNHDGKEYSLNTILKESKLAALMFISTQCPVSNAYNERMVKLHETFSSAGVRFVGINSNKAESPDEITSHCKEHGFKFLVLKDDANKVADAYGAQVTPEIYVINQKGKLLYHGRIDDNRSVSKVESRDLTSALEALLAGKEPPRSETKAFGCTIKRVIQD